MNAALEKAFPPSRLRARRQDNVQDLRCRPAVSEGILPFPYRLHALRNARENVFGVGARKQIRPYADSLGPLGVVSQRLIPKINGGRVLACEIMIANNAIRSLIREGKNFQIPNVIQTSAAEGMISLDKVLAEYVSRGDVSLEEALNYSLDPKSFKMMVY